VSNAGKGGTSVINLSGAAGNPGLVVIY
jgi:hypothetical protein